MNVGDELKINDKRYKVLKIYPDKHTEKDLILCVNEYGCKECFHRFDFIEAPKYEPRYIKLEKDLEDKIVSLLRTGNRPVAVADMLWHEGLTNAVKSKDEFLVKIRGLCATHKIRYYKRTKPVEVLDDDGNVIARYKSIEEASIELDVNREVISQVCNGTYLGKKHNYRFGGTDE